MRAVVKNWAESVLNCEESSSGKLDDLRPRRSGQNCRGNDTGHAPFGMRASAGRREVKKCEKPHTLDQPSIHQGLCPMVIPFQGYHKWS